MPAGREPLERPRAAVRNSLRPRFGWGLVRGVGMNRYHNDSPNRVFKNKSRTFSRFRASTVMGVLRGGGGGCARARCFSNANSPCLLSRATTITSDDDALLLLLLLLLFRPALLVRYVFGNRRYRLPYTRSVYRVYRRPISAVSPGPLLASRLRRSTIRITRRVLPIFIKIKNSKSPKIQ